MSAGTNRSIPTPVSVANGGTGLTAGTSGGILAFTATGTIASSDLLAANALVIGGGAGVAPSTTTTGTGVLVANIARPIFATTVTSNETLEPSVASAVTQEFTGTDIEAVQMPSPTSFSMVAGWAMTFINKSTGNVSLLSYDYSSIAVLAGGQSVTLVLNSIAANATPTAWDVVGQSPPLWLSATNDYLTALNATETDLTWTDRIGNMADALSNWSGGPVNNIFKAPVTGKYTFRTLLQYESTGTAAYPNTGYFWVRLTQSDNTTIKQICTTGVPYIDLGGGPYIAGTNTLEWTLSLTAGDTVKHRVYFEDGGDGNGLYFYAATCQLKITQEL